MMHLLLLALFHIDDLFHLAVVLICAFAGLAIWAHVTEDRT